MRYTLGYPTNGTTQYVWCPVCNLSTLERTPVLLMTGRGMTLVGDWSLCTQCGTSPHATGPCPQGTPGWDQCRARVRRPRRSWCAACGVRKLRTATVELVCAQGRMKIGEWSVCTGCGASPYSTPGTEGSTP